MGLLISQVGHKGIRHTLRFPDFSHLHVLQLLSPDTTSSIQSPSDRLIILSLSLSFSFSL